MEMNPLGCGTWEKMKMNPLWLQHLREDEDESSRLQLLGEDEDESHLVAAPGRRWRWILLVVAPGRRWRWIISVTTHLRWSRGWSCNIVCIFLERQKQCYTVVILERWRRSYTIIVLSKLHDRHPLRATQFSFSWSCTIVILSKRWSCNVNEAFKLEYEGSSMKPLSLILRLFFFFTCTQLVCSLCTNCVHFQFIASHRY